MLMYFRPPASVFRKHSQSVTGRKFAFPLGRPLSIVNHKSPRRMGLGETHCTSKRRLYCTVQRKVPREIKARERDSGLTRAAEETHNEEKLINAPACHRRPEGGRPECDFTSWQFTVFNIKRIRSPRVIRGPRSCRPRTSVSRSCSISRDCNRPV